MKQQRGGTILGFIIGMVVGLAVALAGQKTIENLFGGLVLVGTIITGIFVVVAAAALVLHASKPPRTIYCEVNDRGLIDAGPHRAAVRDIGTLFGAEVVDVGTHHITYMLTSWSKRIEAFITSLQPFGIIETARSGVVAMLRSNVAGTEVDSIPTPATHAVVDATALPPG